MKKTLYNEGKKLKKCYKYYVEIELNFNESLEKLKIFNKNF